MSIVKSTHLNLYSCKYSKKTHTQHQLLVLALFRDFRNLHYREFIDDVGEMDRVQEILGLFSDSSFHHAPEIPLSDKLSLSSVDIQENREPVLIY